MTPSCNYPILVSYEFVLQIVFCSLLCISGGKSFAKYLARLHVAVPMFGTIGRTGCSSSVSFSTCLDKIHLVINISIFVVIISFSFSVKFVVYFLLVFLVGSWSSVLKSLFSSIIKHFTWHFDFPIITTPRPLSCFVITMFWYLENSLTVSWYLYETFILAYFSHVLRNFVFNFDWSFSGIFDMSLRIPW